LNNAQLGLMLIIVGGLSMTIFEANQRLCIKKLFYCGIPITKKMDLSMSFNVIYAELIDGSF